MSDDSLAESCALALGVDNMLATSAHFEALGERLNAALTLRAISLTGVHGHLTRMREVELIDQALHQISGGERSTGSDDHIASSDLELKLHNRLVFIDRARRAEVAARTLELIQAKRQRDGESWQLASLESKLHHVLLVRALHCLLYTSPSPRDATLSRMPSSA